MQRRILYFVGVSSSTSKGVVKKISNRIVLLNEYSNIHALYFGDITLDINIPYSHIRETDSILNSVAAIQDYNPDIIIMRYIGGGKEIIQFLNIFKNKVVFEHNTIEISEILATIQAFNLRDFGYLIRNNRISDFTDQIRSFYFEKRYGKQLRQLALGGIAVTNEIARFQNAICKQYPIQVISNGINTIYPSIRASKSSPFQLLFLCGGNYAWHGIERLIASFNAYSIPENFQIHIYGAAKQKYVSSILESHVSSITFYDRVELAEIRETKQFHAGISSLSMYKAGLKEACPLKTRDYIALGLPIIYAYTDTDIQSWQHKNTYCLQFPNSDSKIDFNTIFDFLSNVPDSKVEIRAFAESILTRVKMQEMSKYLAKLKPVHA